MHDIGISYKKSKIALPDIYARHPRDHSACVYIRQSTSACVIITMVHFLHSTIHLNLKLTGQLAYTVTYVRMIKCDYVIILGHLMSLIVFLKVSKT